MTMSDPDSVKLGVSVSDFLEALFERELSDVTRYDPQVVALVKQHLGGPRIYSRAGDRLAEALVQLAKVQAEEEGQ